MLERGLHVDHTTMYRWVQRYAPELEKRCRPHLKGTTDSWRVDETSVKVKGSWMYLYRAVDSQGTTLEFHLSASRDAEAAKRFFAKALSASHTVIPRVITVDKNAAYPKAVTEGKNRHESCPKSDQLTLFKREHMIPLLLRGSRGDLLKARSRSHRLLKLEQKREISGFIESCLID
ncbi:hypothetical protein KSX_53790 [Ktedonospora formicarum]|uniref:DDE domain-containing protein n=1 Tax=Ktedonospora formicarum TaxID=2778364 RepID=A0A8J3MUR6_9CHLR|nr:hypothetical protein KSX_53790 [Ktedonospora formicarum]